ncbi:hypothetical protein K0U00_13555, partial [Paenibacillus sepulcri]|nr:hypothetical protein [Paenibacillus sepulcri]
MKRPWYYRMLLSYLPILLFISSFLFFIFFQELSAQSKRDAVKANHVLNLLAMNKVENSLNGIDYALVDFTLNNKVLNQFFQSKSKQNVVLNKEMLKEIETFKRQNPLVDSIYLVRSQDEIVLTERYMFSEDDFPENAYIREMEQSTGSMKWTSPHSYQEFAQSAPKNMVTLARSYFTPLGERCLVVANVKVDTLRLLVEQTYNPEVSFVSVTGADDTDILGNRGNLKDHQMLSETRSDYLNWTFRSGLVNGAFSKLAFEVSKFWIILGAITVILGLVAIVYVTRRNYRPLENVVSQIQSLGTGKPIKTGTNEFMLIESAIEDLKKRSTIMEKQQEEEITLRKKHFLYEVIEGIRHIREDEWADEMAKYNLPEALQGAQVLAIEIDNYAVFNRSFTKRDQFLFKYAIHNSATEIFHNYSLSCWSEWVSGKRLICIVLQSEHAGTERTRQACGEFL